MASDGQANLLQKRLASRWNLTAKQSAAPSWIVSVALHGTLLVLFATSMRSCSGTPNASVGEGDVRQVGIYVKENAIVEKKDADVNEQQDAAVNSANASKVGERPQQPETTDSLVNELIDVPNVNDRRLGVGGPSPTASAADVDNLLKANGGGRPDVTGAMANRATSFFDIKAQGSRFAYVVDRSGSMGDYDAIRVAKSELMASLQSLDGTQQFQIVFYNTGTLPMSPRGATKRQLFWATDINRTLASQFIAGVQPDGGTDHVPALKMAMKFGPEHIFFLTDADEPQLSVADLNELKRFNGGRSQIHCIEFGKGPQLTADNFLRRLARQSGGSYRYRDVTTFRQKTFQRR